MLLYIRFKCQSLPLREDFFILDCFRLLSDQSGHLFPDWLGELVANPVNPRCVNVTREEDVFFVIAPCSLPLFSALPYDSGIGPTAAPKEVHLFSSSQNTK